MMTEEVMSCHVSRVTPVSLWQEACHTQDTDLSICSSPHEENILLFSYFSYFFSCFFSFLCFVNYKFKFIQQTFPVIQMQKILTLDDIKICEFERVKWVYWEKYVIGRVGCDRCYVTTRTMPLHSHRPASHSHIPTMKTSDKNLIKLPWHIITLRDTQPLCHVRKRYRWLLTGKLKFKHIFILLIKHKYLF